MCACEREQSRLNIISIRRIVSACTHMAAPCTLLLWSDCTTSLSKFNFQEKLMISTCRYIHVDITQSLVIQSFLVGMCSQSTISDKFDRQGLLIPACLMNTHESPRWSCTKKITGIMLNTILRCIAQELCMAVKTKIVTANTLVDLNMGCRYM